MSRESVGDRRQRHGRDPAGRGARGARGSTTATSPCSATSRTRRTTGSCCRPCSRAPTPSTRSPCASRSGTPTTASTCARGPGPRDRARGARRRCWSTAPRSSTTSWCSRPAASRRCRRSAAWSGSTARCTRRCTRSAASTTAADRGPRAVPAGPRASWSVAACSGSRSPGARVRGLHRGRRGRRPPAVAAGRRAGGRGPQARDLKKLGTEVYTGARAVRLTDEGLKLDNGFTLDTDLVVLTAGGRPSTALARRAGLDRTPRRRRRRPPAHRRRRRIFAIGDCAEHAGRVTGFVPPAWEQAGLLAACLTGEDVKYDGSRTVARLRATGLDVAVLGDPRRAGAGHRLAPFVPAGARHDLEGCFVYRTIDDLEAIADFAAGPPRRRGRRRRLLGLEAANALRPRPRDHVVEFAPRLMPVQVDDGGGAALRRHVEDLGVHVHTGADDRASRAATGPVAGMASPTATRSTSTSSCSPPASARATSWPATAGLDVGERGGVVVDEAAAPPTRTSTPSASARRTAGAPGAWSRPATDGRGRRRPPARGPATFTGATCPPSSSCSASTSPASATRSPTTPEGASRAVYADPSPASTRSSSSTTTGRSCSAASSSATRRLRRAACRWSGRRMPTPETPRTCRSSPPVARRRRTVGVAPARRPRRSARATTSPRATICAPRSTDGLHRRRRRQGLHEGRHRLRLVRAAGQELVDDELARRPAWWSTPVRALRADSRPGAVRRRARHGHPHVRRARRRHGTGRGCEICKPAVASILASLGNGYILDGEQARPPGHQRPLPRQPPARRHLLGRAARARRRDHAREADRHRRGRPDFGLYTKITGGQRIDLFGARVEQLPASGERLVDAGFESGHAYGKALRTVKSCVGSTWCRYGVQDSVAARHRPRAALPRPAGAAQDQAGRVRLRPRVRRGAEQGRRRHRHREGLEPLRRRQRRHAPRARRAARRDLDTETLVRYLDRFLMYYVRTADRLERTAPWLESLDGRHRPPARGRRRRRARHRRRARGRHGPPRRLLRRVEGYPEKLARFVSFINAPARPGPEHLVPEERGQIRPADFDGPVSLGSSIPVGAPQ
jgi:nitrite reductase (NADH) large subunit